MRRLVLIAVAALVAAGAAVSAAKPRSCAPKQARVVHDSKRVEVYRLKGRTYACHVDARTRRALLDHPSSSSTVFWLSAIRLAGDFVGHGVVVSREDDWPGVVVRNIRTGAVLHLAEAVTPLGRRDDKLRAYVTDLVLHPSGDVAWIAQNANVWPTRFEVYKIDTAGRRVLLDSSWSIRPQSLALSGRTVHWIDDDKRRLSRLR